MRMGIVMMATLMLALGCAPAREKASSYAVGPTAAGLVAEYIERYFALYPTRAVEAGRHDFDGELEVLSAAQLTEWIAFNRDTLERIDALVATGEPGFDDRLDLELIERQARLALFDLETLERPRTDPLFWTRSIGNATVFLLVRDDAPLEQRLAGAAARARRLPELAGEAEKALTGSAARVAPEIAQIAARQVRAAAQFYGEGFAHAADAQEESLREELAGAGSEAQKALSELADFLEELAQVATGTVRLGGDYAERFRLATGESSPVEEVLARAQAALDSKRREVAAFGREVWADLMGEETPPAAPEELLRRLFARIGDDHASTVDEFVADYETLLLAAVDFVRRHDVVTLPEPLTVHTSRSPSFFVGQSVGGVYPGGPYSPVDAKTLFFLPTPPDGSTAEQQESFFRDFNHHFNVMITPHEMVPGHYLQLKLAARHPHKVRALFGDGVYIEGWGTFCERLMLDLGWGGPADRLAHLKKQLENIARTIVDIRVHTESMSRQEVLDFVRGEAFQETQFASNMWTRSITSAPQLTTYYLGYTQVLSLFDDARQVEGEGFVLKRFMDRMMELGPVPVARYRELILRE
ncbi:MAG: DUF885 domain-containing protein [Acidobacteria bacterium]|nr:DUF885 domain-containing protein [Acidobacteriota bacterium]